MCRRFIGAYESGQRTCHRRPPCKSCADVFGVSADCPLSDETKNLATVPITVRTLLEYFEEVQRFDEADQQAVKRFLEAVIIKTRMRAMVGKEG